jgi:Zn-dependent protease
MIPLNQMAPEGSYFASEIDAYSYQYDLAPELMENTTFTVLSLLAVMLYLGIGLNLNLMFFNLIPLPPLDGSRIAFIFLPTNVYFKIMQYERYIMIAFVVLLATGIISLPLGFLTNGVSDILFKITGMNEELLMAIRGNILNSLPKFSL